MAQQLFTVTLWTARSEYIVPGVVAEDQDVAEIRACNIARVRRVDLIRAEVKVDDSTRIGGK